MILWFSNAIAYMIVCNTVSHIEFYIFSYTIASYVFICDATYYNFLMYEYKITYETIIHFYKSQLFFSVPHINLPLSNTFDTLFQSCINRYWNVIIYLDLLYGKV